MAPLTKFTAGHIRELYASGLYHKADLVVRFVVHFDSPKDLLDVLSYKVFPDIRPELCHKILGIPHLHEAVKEYHSTLVTAAAEEFKNVLGDPKNAPAKFEQYKREASTKLWEKVQFINREFDFNFSLYDAQTRVFK